MATETGFIQFVEGSAPSTPGTGKWRIYTKSTGLYVVDDAGTEYGPLAADGAAAHIADSSDAHDASAISLADAGGNTTETDVEGAIDELYGLVGGGAAVFIDYAIGKQTGGNKTLNSTNWANVDTGWDLVLDAATGDILEVNVSAFWGNENVNGYLDIATIVSASPVNYLGSGPITASTGNGIPGLAREGASTNVRPAASSIDYVVQSGDISGGTVTLRLRYRTGAASNLTLRANSTDTPFLWSAKTFRP